jgi:hypothetical protein
MKLRRLITLVVVAGSASSLALAACSGTGLVERRADRNGEGAWAAVASGLDDAAASGPAPPPSPPPAPAPAPSPSPPPAAAEDAGCVDPVWDPDANIGYDAAPLPCACPRPVLDITGVSDAGYPRCGGAIACNGHVYTVDCWNYSVPWGPPYDQCLCFKDGDYRSIVRWGDAGATECTTNHAWTDCRF